EYAQAIGETLLANVSPEKFPTVYLESGRSIIDESGYLLTSVTASKRLLDGRKTYILDAGVNFLFTTTWYDIPVKVGIEIEGPAEDVTLYGPLCMNIDVVRENVKLPPLSPGTPLVFNPVGAYCVTQWMQFIEYRPNVVMISESGEVEIIREAETLEDVIARERIPERLTKFEL
ncbi:diaminopimelate decarboxylase, partial [bacterium]|nr:diaminopimelate decarboxylase [bacterium]